MMCNKSRAQNFLLQCRRGLIPAGDFRYPGVYHVLYRLVWPHSYPIWFRRYSSHVNTLSYIYARTKLVSRHIVGLLKVLAGRSVLIRERTTLKLMRAPAIEGKSDIGLNVPNRFGKKLN
jgi:hypothetical protein